MKKIYIIPETEVISIPPTTLMTGSNETLPGGDQGTTSPDDHNDTKTTGWNGWEE